MTVLFETQKAKVSELTPHVSNPRKIKQEEKRKLYDRLQKYGMIGIPTLDFDGTLLSGHRRCEVLMQYGFGDTIIDVRKAVRKLTEEELKEVMMIENTHAGEFDMDILRAEFDKVMDLADYGFSFEQLEADISEALGEQNQEAEMPIVAKFSEKYTAFVIVCENEIDENHVAEKLGAERQKCYKSSAIGAAYVVSAKAVISRWKGTKTATGQ